MAVIHEVAGPGRNILAEKSSNVAASSLGLLSRWPPTHVIFLSSLLEIRLYPSVIFCHTRDSYLHLTI